MSNLGSIQAPDLSSYVDKDLFAFSANFNCHQLGTIKSFNASLQTAEIEIGVLRQFGDSVKNYPLLVDCPVFVMSGGPTGVITMPVAAGDTCLVCFNDRDIDNWFSTGLPAVPNSKRLHSLADGLALVGFRNKANSVQGYSASAIELKNLGSEISIDGAISLLSSLNAQLLLNANFHVETATAAQMTLATKLSISNSNATLFGIFDLIIQALYALNSAKTGSSVVAAIDLAALEYPKLIDP